MMTPSIVLRPRSASAILVGAAVLSVALLAVLPQSADAQPLPEPIVRPGSVESRPVGIESRSATVEIGAANRTWTDLGAGLSSVEQGPITLDLRSPAHELTVHANRLVLEPLDDGLIHGIFEVDLEGWGDLEVDVRTIAGTTPMEDRVVAKRQWVRTEAKIHLELAPAGYWLTMVEAFRPSVGVLIESQLARQLVDACRGMKAIPLFGGLDCDSLSASLTRVEIPMPEPGTRYYIASSLLSPGEQAVFDRFTRSLLQ